MEQKKSKLDVSLMATDKSNYWSRESMKLKYDMMLRYFFEAYVDVLLEF
jgi:hypothetical protein